MSERYQKMMSAMSGKRPNTPNTVAPKTPTSNPSLNSLRPPSRNSLRTPSRKRHLGETPLASGKYERQVNYKMRREPDEEDDEELIENDTSDVLLPRGSGFDSDGEGENGNFENVESRQKNTSKSDGMFGDGMLSPTKIGDFFVQLGKNREDITRGQELFKSAARDLKGISIDTLCELARNASEDMYPLYISMIGTLKIMELEKERRVFKDCKGPVENVGNGEFGCKKYLFSGESEGNVQSNLPNLSSLLFAPLSGGNGDIRDIFGSCSSMTNSLRLVVKHVALHSIDEVLPLSHRHLYTIANKPQRGLTAIPSKVLNALVDAFLMVIVFPGRTDLNKKDVEESVCTLWAHYWTYATTKARSDLQKNRSAATGNSGNMDEDRP